MEIVLVIILLDILIVDLYGIGLIMNILMVVNNDIKFFYFIRLIIIFILVEKDILFIINVLFIIFKLVVLGMMFIFVFLV